MYVVIGLLNLARVPSQTGSGCSLFLTVHETVECVDIGLHKLSTFVNSYLQFVEFIIPATAHLLCTNLRDSLNLYHLLFSWAFCSLSTSEISDDGVNALSGALKVNQSLQELE